MGLVVASADKPSSGSVFTSCLSVAKALIHAFRSSGVSHFGFEPKALKAEIRAATSSVVNSVDIAVETANNQETYFQQEVANG